MKTFIGVKLVKAELITLGEYNELRGWTIPDDEDPKTEGYLVKYSDDYISWSPKETFESAYFELSSDNNTISKADVDCFFDIRRTEKWNDKTTICEGETVTGFKLIDSSSCVDPANFNEEIGKEICKERMENDIWKMLGFVLQWALNGVKNK